MCVARVERCFQGGHKAPSIGGEPIGEMIEVVRPSKEDAVDAARISAAGRIGIGCRLLQEAVVVLFELGIGQSQRLQ